MFFAQLETTIKGIDHASQQNVSWWFIASLCVLGVFLVGVIRWLLKWIDKQNLDRERKEHEAEVKAVEAAKKAEAKEERNDRLLEARAVMIHQNTQMMSDVKGVLEQVRHLLVELNKKQA